MKMTLLVVAFVFVIAVLFVGCMPDTVNTNGPDAPGFWWGIWHGMISPLSLLVHIFNSDVAVYAKNNCGGWYDFGFLLGCGALASGSSQAGKD